MIKYPEENKVPVLLAMLLALILTLRLISLWFNNSELFFDEAQYWFWAQEPAFGYFSKPPMLAWIINLTTTVCGSDSAFCVRLASPLLHTVTAIFIYLSATTLFDKRVGFWAALLFVILPGISLSATISSTDVPLLMYWSIALYAYVRILKGGTFGWTLLLGAALGAGLMSKYAMVYFIACAIIHALVERNRDHPVFSYKFWFACLIALLLLSPNIWWNLQNSFVTVSHTGDNIGWTGFRLNYTGALEFFGSQFGVFGPVMFGIYLATLWKMPKENLSPAHRMLVAFSLPILLTILFQALMSKAYANWAATTYIAATILVAEILVNRVPGFWLKISSWLHGIVFAALSIAVCFAGSGQLVLPNGVQPFIRTQGGSEIAEQVASLLDTGDYRALVTTDRKLSALMNYYMRNRSEEILAWKPSEIPHDHYQLVSSYQDAGSAPALLVTRRADPASVLSRFGAIERLGERKIKAGEIKSVFFFRIGEYQGNAVDN